MSESLFSCCHYRLYGNQRLRNDDLALTRLTKKKETQPSSEWKLLQITPSKSSSSTSLHDNGGISDNVKGVLVVNTLFFHKRLIILIMFSVGLRLKTFL